jgi:hypothetical protein
MVVTAVLAAQVAGTLDVTDTTKISLRAAQPWPAATAHVDGKPVPGEIILAADATTSAGARLRLRQRQLDYSLAVNGSLSATDLEEQVLPLATVSANAAEAWHDRLFRLALTESGSYGLTSAAVPYQQTAPATSMTPSQPGMTGQPMMPGQPGAMQGQPVAPGAIALLGKQTTVSVGSLDGGGSVWWRAAKMTALTAQGGYTLAGGLDTQSRFVLPQQYGPRASVTVATALSQTDNASMSLRGQDTTSIGLCTLFVPNAPGGQCREEVPEAELDATVRHRTSRTGALAVAGGVAATVAPTPGLNELVIVPIGTVSYSDGFGPHGISTYVLTATVTPTVDIRTGLPSNRVSVTGTLSDRVAPRAALNVTAGLVQSVPFPREDPYPLTLYNSAVEVRFLVDRRAIVGVGLNTYVQHQSLTGPNQAGPGGSEWSASEIGYISVTANATTLHF